MTDRECATVQEQLPDLALELLSGDERATALAHVDRCPRCRATIAELAGVADLLLHLAPEAEPPAGFGDRVLDVVRGGRRRRRVLALVAAAVAAAVLVGAVAVGFLIGRDESPQATRPVAAPSVRTLALLEGDGRPVGQLTVSGRVPAMVEVTVDYAVDGAYTVELRPLGAPRQTLGTMVVSDGHGTWTGGAVIPEGDAVLAMVDGGGVTMCSATLRASSHTA